MSPKSIISIVIPALLASPVLTGSVFGEPNEWTIASPNGNLSVSIVQKTLGHPYPPWNNLYYSVKLDSKEVLSDSPLGVRLSGEDGDFVRDLVFVRQLEKTIDETYPMVSGKKSIHRNYANEKTFIFKNKHGRAIHIIFRAYNDGIAFRYYLPGRGKCEIASEYSGFKLPSGCVGWLQSYTKRHTYQDFYPRCTVDETKSDDIGFPALFELPGGQWVLLTEAAVYGDYVAGHLYGPIRRSPIYSLQLLHKPSGKLPWAAPWRTAIIGKGLGTIVESVLVDNLNPACELKDTSWIKPGRVTFPWWSDHAVSENFEKLKKFVDFAGEMGWEWVEFDTGLVGGRITDTVEPWVSRATDAWTSTEWVPKLVEYARGKGVDVYGWDTWENLDTPKKRRKVFGLFEKFGVKGIKVDYLNSDTQEMFQFRDAVIKDCLKYRLMVSFHGETIPRGQRRRWPHVITWEAVVGSEGYGYGQSPTPTHNCTLPYTRNVVGPMDYTPVIFSTSGQGYRTPFSITDKTTTDAHELALSVIFESGWQCISDTPQAYAACGGKEFLKKVPAAWNDIRFIDGYPGEFVSLARRKDNDWFVAAINAAKPRTVIIPLNFLKQGTYPAKIYKDNSAGRGIVAEDIVVDTQKPLKISLPSNAGFCAQIPDSYDPHSPPQNRLK